MLSPRTPTPFCAPRPGMVRTFVHALEAAGFRRGRRGLRRRELEVSADSSWVTFSRRCGRKDTRTSLQACGPGLWKTVGVSGGALRRELHLPAAAVLHEMEPDSDDFAARVAALLEWVELTARGRIPASWSPPGADITHSVAPPERLLAQSGGSAVRGELVSQPGRFAVVFPLGSKSSPTAAARRDWLAALLAEAQDHWRMVRFRTSKTDQGHEIVVEVDLTGAPHDVIEAVLPPGVDALREVASRLLMSIRIVSDPDAQCAVWELSPPRARPQKGGL